MRDEATVQVVTTDQIARDVAELATFTAPGTGVSRLAYGPEDAAAREWFTRRCEQIGLKAQVDRFGNCFGWSSGAASRDAVALGSHLDSVHHGGRYDGVLGVAVAFAVAQALLANDPDAALCVVAFACEESTRFGIGAIGSRLLTGDLAEAELDRVRDLDGRVLRDVLDSAGLADNETVPFLERTSAYLEVHVDQGSIVASSSQTIGLVPAIAGVLRTRITFLGEASHSGAHARSDRRDALLAAADFIIAADTHWAQADRHGARLAITVGHAVVKPNSSNTVPGEVELVLDVRSPDRTLLEATVTELEAVARWSAHRRGCESELHHLGVIPPVAMNDGLLARLRDHAQTLGIAYADAPSMSGHDAGVVGVKLPAVMVIVANPAGLSHHPDEAIDDESLTATVRLLVSSLAANDGDRS